MLFCTDFIVLGLTRLGLEPTIYHIRGEHVIHYTPMMWSKRHKLNTIICPTNLSLREKGIISNAAIILHSGFGKCGPKVIMLKESVLQCAGQRCWFKYCRGKNQDIKKVS
jgi:hypothetical protein